VTKHSAILKIPTNVEARSDGSQNLKFEREDWTAFRTLDGLQRKAGVAIQKLAQLVLKELADNALDAGGTVKVGRLDAGGYYIKDDGPGIDGSPEEIARLFSISRPLVSTKLLRLPTRGALGNGLRVVAGAVLASEGTLTVTTRNRRLELRPERDGSTTVVSMKPVDFPVGTRIEISFGPELRGYIRATQSADLACQLARGGRDFTGKTSPYWYDIAEFRELLDASGDTPVRELISQFDGCSGAKAGEIVAAAGLSRAACRRLTEEQAAALLKATRENAKQVSHARLGVIGPDLTIDGDKRTAYGCVEGTVHFGSGFLKAEIPYVIEAWASPQTEGAGTVVIACVNKTPVAAEFHAQRDRRDIDFFGCGLAHTVAAAPVTAHFFICLNIITPFMPITSDGKAPNFWPFLGDIEGAVTKAVRKAHRPDCDGKASQKAIVLENLDAVIAAVSGDGEHRFNPRQLLYQLRPIVMKATGEELQTGNFNGIITDYENEHGEIPGMYREPRGSIYHPHLGEMLTLGTLMVESYKRPAWRFNKLVYIEKEGANEALKDVRWPERHDCAVISSKGFSTRAARDLIDKLATHDEEITVYCVTDADAYGSMIYQTLQEATKARGARKIKIIKLGLEPWEAIEMGLEVEDVDIGKTRKAVAEYVLDRVDRAPDGGSWENWLQTHRIELNAMTTPQFISWLDRKMAEHGAGKLIPPAEVLEAELAGQLEERVRESITERILRDAGLDAQVEAALATIVRPDGAALAAGIEDLFEREQDREWRDHIVACVNDAGPIIG
jgi:hypothetical protein